MSTARQQRRRTKIDTYRLFLSRVFVAMGCFRGLRSKKSYHTLARNDRFRLCGPKIRACRSGRIPFARLYADYSRAHPERASRSYKARRLKMGRMYRKIHFASVRSRRRRREYRVLQPYGALRVDENGRVSRACGKPRNGL